MVHQVFLCFLPSCFIYLLCLDIVFLFDVSIIYSPKLGTKGFKGWTGLLQHNGNSFAVLLEVILMGGLPVMLSHASFAPLFAGIYQAFLWFMANRWAPNHGPVFPYFFMDTTLGRRTTIFMVVLLAVIGFFFILFALLDMGMTMIEQGGHGAIPNVCCVIFMSYMLMKLKD
mmetsp:Transcript_25214/g.52697  ORF Transcript_25214/g.52697 Transcript_25214/m.52697 type:complete len:171 (+) Transcript_25214:693-1205(+)